MVWQDSLKTMSTLQDRVSLLFLLKIFTLKSERERSLVTEEKVTYKNKMS